MGFILAHKKHEDFKRMAMNIFQGANLAGLEDISLVKNYVAA